MELSTIYLISVLFGFVPYMLERTLVQIKLKKDGYNYNNENYTLKMDIADIFGNLFFSLIPGINIIKGLKGIIRLIFFKHFYASKKMSLLFSDKIYLEKEHTELDEVKELLYSLGDVIGVSKEERKTFDKAIEILSLHEFVLKSGYKIDEEFNNYDFEQKYEYLKKVEEEIKNNEEKVNKSKSFDEMSTQEKISYLRREKEDIENIDSSEKKLLRSKNESKK